MEHFLVFTFRMRRRRLLPGNFEDSAGVGLSDIKRTKLAELPQTP